MGWLFIVTPAFKRLFKNKSTELRERTKKKIKELAYSRKSDG